MEDPFTTIFITIAACQHATCISSLFIPLPLILSDQSLACSSRMAPVTAASRPVQCFHSKVRPGEREWELQSGSAPDWSQWRVLGQHRLSSGDPGSPLTISSRSLCGLKKITVTLDQTAV